MLAGSTDAVAVGMWRRRLARGICDVTTQSYEAQPEAASVSAFQLHVH
jgi:hypothetical protein